MRLYYFPVAPNPTKVRLYLAEKGIGVEQIAVDLRAGEQQSPDFLRKNPMGKLPVLELDDGTAVNESLAIIEYFEELHPDPPMIGRTPEERLKVRALERHCDIGILVNLARVVHATHSPLGLPPKPEVAAFHREQLDLCARVLDDKIGDGPFVAGDHVTIADCTLWAALGFGGVFGVELDPSCANIHAWRGRFFTRPSVKLD
jgi:glutathione S-transferase